ncbi:MAG: hypothetical protein JXA41_01955 [Deltaproteobacteria bacterium]|nr:hypothetical protein [Deltaproteobacteria bacterium]
MKPYEILPNKEIIGNSEVEKAFLKLGIKDLHNACEYVTRLPYGRTSDKTNFMQVLPEGRGSCSTKHALIASLAAELAIDVQLMLGIYMMCEANTPGVEKVLANSGCVALPEAHCYLKYRDQRIDLTRLTVADREPIIEFIHEETIDVSQIGDYKKTVHQDFMKQWMTEDRFEAIWSLREACIKVLSG